ncbi:hypothetical protein [Pseudodonghicola flavimaris]|uniref:DOMON-like domain-containing protein n=1 Tax=Pseudodonghicola flavimaris TaxID=3050036 RepID=A0ABT7F881_9RHOB|nr:hypothetical protein [Pseudodonghicola flavimaris]MDK3020807.1 hypothetical protein [Pseudodonghicola flavimaris]
MTSQPPPPSVQALRSAHLAGEIDAPRTVFAAGLQLHADPALQLSGQWRSPSGRLLELDLRMSGQGEWIGLHLTLDAPDLAAVGWIGFACRSAAPEELLIRPCLRSGTESGFTDTFFDKHLLSTPEPHNHMDALHPATRRELPETAPWRELILFLPRRDCRWHLQDLRPISI